ncbi:hypothetical protein BgiBS90_001991 [Biomphalaria glabrata]|nr:hypothetical protein BgiBS90_001991 [Biomphalaria glabrata]
MKKTFLPVIFLVCVWLVSFGQTDLDVNPILLTGLLRRPAYPSVPVNNVVYRQSSHHIPAHHRPVQRPHGVRGHHG